MPSSMSNWSVSVLKRFVEVFNNAEFPFFDYFGLFVDERVAWTKRRIFLLEHRPTK